MSAEMLFEHLPAAENSDFKGVLLKIFARPEAAERCAEVISARGSLYSGGWRWYRVHEG